MGGVLSSLKDKLADAAPVPEDWEVRWSRVPIKHQVFLHLSCPPLKVASHPCRKGRFTRMQTVSQTQGPFTRLLGCTSASLGWSRGPCVPSNAPKISCVCQGCFQPPLIFPTRARAVGRQAQLREQGAPPPPGRGAGRARGLSWGPAPRVLLCIPPARCSARTSQGAGPGACLPSWFTSGLGGFCFLFFWSCFDFPQKRCQCLRPDPLLRRIMIFRGSSPFPRCHSSSQGTRKPSGSRGREQPANSNSLEAAPLPAPPVPRARSHGCPWRCAPAAGPRAPTHGPGTPLPSGPFPGRCSPCAPGCTDRPRASLTSETSRSPELPPRLRLL